MMQPSPSSTTTSVFDAIKDGDWEGLLALYATTAFDAVRSADFARRGADLHHREHSSPPAFMAAMPGSPRRGVFRDEKKVAQQSFKSMPDTFSSPIYELDLIVREIIGADVFDDHQGSNAEALTQDTQNTKRQPNKRKTPPSPSVRRNKEMSWEKVMWDSASVLSNSRPSPSFVVNRQDRERRQDFDDGVGALDSM